MAYNLTGVDLDVFIAANSAGNVFIFLILILPPLILCLLCIVALFLAHDINWPMRVALINIYAGEVLSWIARTLLLLGYPARAHDPSEVVSCQAAISTIISAALLSFPAIALYAVLVYAFGVKKLRLKVILPLIALSWIIAFGIGSVPYIPNFGLMNSSGFCIFNSMSLTFMVASILATAILVGSLGVIITFSILTFCYLRKNTLEENVAVKEAVAKNLGYLLVAAVLYFISYFIPTSFSAIRLALRNHGLLGVVVVEYVFQLALILPSLATPVMPIVILKPVRTAMLDIFKVCACCKKDQVAEE